MSLLKEEKYDMSAFLEKFGKGLNCAFDEEDILKGRKTDGVALNSVGQSFKPVRAQYNRMSNTGPVDAFAMYDESYLILPAPEGVFQEHETAFLYYPENKKPFAVIAIEREDPEDVDEAKEDYFKKIKFSPNDLTHEAMHFLDREEHAKKHSASGSIQGRLFSGLPIFKAILDISAKKDRDNGKILQGILSHLSYHSISDERKVSEIFCILGEIVWGDKTKNRHLATSLQRQFYEGIISAAIEIDTSPISTPEKQAKREKLAGIVRESTQKFSADAELALEGLNRKPKEEHPAILNRLQTEASTVLAQAERQARQELNLSMRDIQVVNASDDTPSSPVFKRHR